MVIGAVSYAAPLFSVVILIATGYGAYHWSVALACGLIVIGALVGAKDGHPWAGGRADDLRPYTPATLLTAGILGQDGHALLPTFRVTNSPW